MMSGDAGAQPVTFAHRDEVSSRSQILFLETNKETLDGPIVLLLNRNKAVCAQRQLWCGTVNASRVASKVPCDCGGKKRHVRLSTRYVFYSSAGKTRA